MKLTHTFLVIAMTGYLVGCAELSEKTSHYGHGSYRCYFHNSRTGHIYRGVAAEEKEAARLARFNCRVASSDHIDKMACVFSDCVFK